MSDTKREIYIRLLRDLYEAFFSEDAIRDMLELLKEEPERKKGKWIYKHCVWFCSECGENPTKGMGYVQGQYELYNFCPNCGCQMNGGEQE